MIASMKAAKEAWSRIAEPFRLVWGIFKYSATPASIDAERRIAQEKAARLGRDGQRRRTED